MKSFLIRLILMILPHTVIGQYFVTDHVMATDSTTEVSKGYTVQDMAWISGYWVGEGLGGQVEEIWSKPKNGKMVCAFRFDMDGALVFSEHVIMTDKEEGISMLVKHFSSDFKAWESKEEYVEFPIISIDGHTAYFNGCTFIRHGNHLDIYVLIGHDGVNKEERFSYDLKTY